MGRKKKNRGGFAQLDAVATKLGNEASKRPIKFKDKTLAPYELIELPEPIDIPEWKENG